MLIVGALVSGGFLVALDTPVGIWGIGPFVTLIIITTGILLLIPVSYIMQMGAERLPATLALLYTPEIATSVVTAALFLPGEHFGWFEALGAGLIAGAGLVQATKAAMPPNTRTET